jgi:hypothetical protein
MRFSLAAMIALTVLTAAAQDDEASEGRSDEQITDELIAGETEECVSTRRIRRTKVIDDSTIAFYMRNRDVYVNLLPRRCPQLASSGRFAYEARGGRLCSINQITVLVRAFGSQLEPGFSCRLGDFHVSDAETVALMIETAQQGGRTSPVTAESVELPPEEGDEDDED